MRQYLLLSIIALALFTVSCKKWTPLTVEKINDNQVAPLNSLLPQPLKIKALNHKNEPIEGLKVRFFIKNGSGILEGNVYESYDTTDSEGFAECIFYLGYDANPQQVEVDMKRYDGETVIFTANPEYAQDTRDGEKYLLTKIGGVVWTAQNIRYNEPGSRANPDFPSNVFGRLYDWYDAQGVCPAGFRLPTIADYQAMTTAVGNEYYTIGKKLKSRNSWLYVEDGKNLVGFDLLPAGNFITSIGEYRGLGEYSALWTTDEQTNLNGKYAILSYNSLDVYYTNYAKSTASSCRCIRE